MPIVKLDSTLISQIAAGEVLERPACAVRELLDNAIDAKAQKIVVRIEGGGLVKIQVEDDGEGIEKEDLALVFERHATSKIKTFDDLLQVGSLGFRGEAMAAMSSVANASIETKRKGEDVGYKIKCHGGVLFEPTPIVRTETGTCVTLEHLFFHVPARRKFLKTEGYEAQKCREVFLRTAMGNPQVQMSFFKDGKLLHQFKAQEDKEQRVLDILGSGIGQWHEVNYTLLGGKIRVEGYFAPLKALPSHKEVQYLFVNKRIAKDKALSHAIKEAQLSAKQGKECAYVLWLTLPQEEVDVNAHPAKTQLRFKESRVLYQVFYNAIQNALEVQKSAPSESEFERYQKNQQALRALGGQGRVLWEAGAQEEQEDLFEKEPASSPTVELMPKGFLDYYGWNILETAVGFWVIEGKLWGACCKAYEIEKTLHHHFLEAHALIEPVEMVLEIGTASALQRQSKQLESLGFEFQVEGARVKLFKISKEFENINIPVAYAALGEMFKKGVSNAFEVLLCLHLHGAREVSNASPDGEILWEKFLNTQWAQEKKNFYHFFPKLT